MSHYDSNKNEVIHWETKECENYPGWKKLIAVVVLVSNGVGITPENVEIVGGLGFVFVIRNREYLQNIQEDHLLVGIINHALTTNPD